MDDIQFCGDRVPAAYAQPSPIQSSRQSLPGKQYLWRSHWLSGEADLIRPLSSLELEYVAICSFIKFMYYLEDTLTQLSSWSLISLVICLGLLCNTN